MSGASEGDALAVVQRRWPDVPVIIVSPETSVEDCVHALNAGADDFVVQPFVMAELVVARTCGVATAEPAVTGCIRVRRSGS